MGKAKVKILWHIVPTHWSLIEKKSILETELNARCEGWTKDRMTDIKKYIYVVMNDKRNWMNLSIKWICECPL